MFDVEYQVDESCLRVLVPHLILQPLVENAVYHGIKPMGGNGHIRIRIGPEEGGRMKIQVRDNGVGIDASALSKLQDYHKYGILILTCREPGLADWRPYRESY
mgnify:CR=1 FL=1